MSRDNQDNGVDLQQLADAGAMILDLVKLVREHRDSSDRSPQRYQLLAQAVERYRSLHLVLQKAHFGAISDDIDSYSEIQTHAFKVRHRALEISACIREYVSLPCKSLEEPMLRCLWRYADVIEQLEQEEIKVNAIKGGNP